MPRSLKTGLEYFPLNVVFNRAFRNLEEIHGCEGFTWMIKFWQEAYQTEDGIVDLNEEQGPLMAKQTRITPEKQNEIIATAKKYGMLQEIAPNIYTSERIQKNLSVVTLKREYARNYKKNE